MLLLSPKTAIPKPPRRFRAAKGVSAARIVVEPQFAQTNGVVHGAKGKGLRYEARVKDYLDTIVKEPWAALPGPWFEFVDRSGFRYAQADWIAFNFQRGLVCIAEIKLSRVPEAWWQLNKLYKPIVRSIFPDWDIACLEIAHIPHMVAVPEDVRVIQELDQVEVDKTCFMQVSYD